MKFKVGGLAVILGAATLCFSASAFAQLDGSVQPNATVSFTNAPDGVFDPYQGTVTINGQSVYNAGLIACDDDAHSISAPETWNATAIQISTLTAANLPLTVFGVTNPGTGSNGAIGLTGYEEVAALGSALFGLSAGNPTATVAGVSGLTNQDLSQAIWLITSPVSVAGENNVGTISTNAMNVVAALQAEATADTLAPLTSASYSNLWIFSPNTNNMSGWNNGEPQEMLTEVPEGGAAFLYLLLAAAACFGAMRFKSHNQLAS